MTKLIIDGVEIDVPPDYTLLQACEAAGAEIPRFCYHERLSIAGNCRMCLVEVKGSPKPVASCAQQVRDQRPGPNGEPPVVNTKTPLVKKAREGVMEFLLINHPLDCPICDQGGECDLQDQAMAYGRSGTRFDENKRAVEEKHMGPLIKTVMTRCIQCTRCVRFATEIAGVAELGATGRGEDMEITTYLEAAMTSELSGNVIDLCPVGALTSKPYAFNARPWELKKTETIDVMDAVGSNIRMDARGPEVLRILPRVNEEINEEWISDKTRFVWDGLKRQRLDRPFLRKDGRLTPINWDEALSVAAARLSIASEKIALVAGDLAVAEGAFALRRLGDARQIAAKASLGPDMALDLRQGREGYLFNTTIMGLEDADALVLIGCDPRREAPLINARIRKTWLRGGLQIAAIGASGPLNYRVLNLGGDVAALEALAAGKGLFAETMAAAKRPALILGEGALARADGAQVLRRAGEISARYGIVRAATTQEPHGWNGFNVLHAAAGRVGALDLGFASRLEGRFETVYLLQADDVDLRRFDGAFVIYQGSHGDAGAARADLVLPAASYAEQDGLWVNTEGRVQMARRAVFPKGEAKEDWAILRAIAGRMGVNLGFDHLAQLREVLVRAAPSFGMIDHAPGASPVRVGFDPAQLGEAGPLGAAPIAPTPLDFYRSNPIARASRVMAECAEATAPAAPELAAE